jgi:CBS domain-containing protein
MLGVQSEVVMLVQDVMQKGILSVSPELGLADFEQMLTSEDISGAPVMGSDDRLVGIASKTDIVRALSEQAGARADELAPELTVEDIMTSDVVTAGPSEPVQDVARRMIDGRLHRVLVVEDGEVVGIVTTFDLLEAVFAAEA